jgi:hypothetical protein
MNLSDYVIDQEGIDWTAALSDWGWLLPANFTLWIVTRLADLIIVDECGSVSFVDVSGGSIEPIATSREEFFSIVDDPGNGSNWFAFGLVDKCVAAGVLLAKGRCYGLTIPSVLGGEFDPGNIRSVDIADYLRFLAGIHRQIADLPDGAQVELRVVA